MNTVMRYPLLLSLLMMTGTALAAESAPVLSQANITLSASNTATVALSAVSGLTAGTLAGDTRVATGTAVASAGLIACRWTPTAGTVNPAGAGYDYIDLRGKNAGKTLRFRLTGCGVASPSSPAWFVAPGSSASLVITTAGYSQPSAADAYTLSVDSAVWVE